MADQYTKAHSAVKPDRIKVTDTLYVDGEATITYVYCWGITGDEGSGYDYYTRTLQTKFPVSSIEILAVRDAIRNEYAKFVAEWNAGSAERATVLSWSDYVILE